MRRRPYTVRRMCGLLEVSAVTTRVRRCAVLESRPRPPATEGGHDSNHRLLDDPTLMPTAIEEFLRVYAPVTMARLVKEDVEIDGCPMKVDEWVLLPFPAANVDPSAFEHADEVIIDRAENRHLAFGLGIHRCLGSNLARLEVRVAVEEFLARFPEFEVADPDGVAWSLGQVRGPRRLPFRILPS